MNFDVERRLWLTCTYMLQRGVLLGQLEREEVRACLSVARGNTQVLLWNLSSAACCSANTVHSEASLLTSCLLGGVKSALSSLASPSLLGCLCAFAMRCSSSILSLAWLYTTLVAWMPTVRYWNRA